MLPLMRTGNQTLDNQQTRWKAEIDPLLTAPLAGLLILEGVTLTNGATVINHKLGRLPQGWFLTDLNGAATIYRSQPFNKLTLTLTSNAVVTANIGVF